MNTISSLRATAIAIIPAAGVGSRMSLNIPKQYIKVQGYTILEHSIKFFLSHKNITKIIIVLNKRDVFFRKLSISSHPRVFSVIGGKLRVHSVLAGLLVAHDSDWVVIHDAVRPCLCMKDLNKIMSLMNTSELGGILATPISNTIKYSIDSSQIFCTINRNQLWNALTPQCFPSKLLLVCLQKVIHERIDVTDEASALEYNGYYPQLVQGSSKNIKITYPEDIIFLNFYLKKYYKRIRL
ncbi:MAG: 2-C-methyl-D-erythritol 4-phosphate cytidylyltransferase [Buchnera aphidicola (Schlechtendalia peitan)]